MILNNIDDLNAQYVASPTRGLSILTKQKMYVARA